MRVHFCDWQGHVSERPVLGSQKEGKGRAGSLQAPSAKRLKTQHRCSKCGFVTDDGAQFQQHIPQHKTDENTPQCLHCGLCFTSMLSLKRHLFIVHKVKDPEEEETEEEEEEAATGGEVREKEQDNQPVRPAETNEVNDSSPEGEETEPSQAEEPAGLHCDKTADCNSNLSAHSPTVSPQY